MLNLPVKPKKKRAKRHNRISKTGYFTDEGVEQLDYLSRHMNASESEVLTFLVDRAYRELTKGAS
jgi:hypothetical protein